jgi:hypothetical protein
MDRQLDTPGRRRRRDGVTGRLVDAMFVGAKEREVWGRYGRDRVSREFLIFSEVRRWLQLLAEVASSSTQPQRRD